VSARRVVADVAVDRFPEEVGAVGSDQVARGGDVSGDVLPLLRVAVRRARLREREGEDSTSAWHAIWDEEYSFGTIRPPEAFDLVIERLIDR
jgi:hypothetical protein